MESYSIVQKFMAELIATSMLVILGDGVCCNHNLRKSGMNGCGSTQITLAWGFAVLLPAFIFGKISGAQMNPAVTLGMALIGSTPWHDVFPYIVAQLTGGYIGAAVLVAIYKEHFRATDDQDLKRNCFCTSPAIDNPYRNFLSEMVCGFLLIFSLAGISQSGAINGMNYFLIYAVIVSIGMSLGGLTGYAMNPARDLAPRMAYATLPVPGKGSAQWNYAWIPSVAPCVGAVLAAGLYKTMIVVGVFHI